MLYEIQHKINTGEAYIWRNCWSDDNGQPQLFKTEGEALLALGEYLAACTLAVADGDITCHVPDDYRIAARYIA